MNRAVERLIEMACKYSVKELDLSKLELKKVPESITGLNSSLRNLDLKFNYLIDTSALSNLSNLESLDLQSAADGASYYRSSLTANLEKLVNLKYLNASSGNLNDLSSFIIPENIEILDIRYNSFKRGLVLNDFKKLKDLNISKAHLGIDSILSLPENITYLDLSGGSNEVHRSLFKINNLSNLSYLNLEDTKIGSIQGIRNLTNLEILNLSRCDLKNIKELLKLDKLKKLIISSNPLSKDDSVLQELKEKIPEVIC